MTTGFLPYCESVFQHPYELNYTCFLRNNQPSEKMRRKKYSLSVRISIIKVKLFATIVNFVWNIVPFNT